MIFSLKDGQSGQFVHAALEHIDDIIKLYNDVYKGKYTLAEVTDPVIVEEKINDPNFFWILAIINNKLVGSLIFGIDPVNKVGKTYAAAILEEYRGHGLMKMMTRHGVKLLTQKTRTCDVIYATARTISYAPQIILKSLGFLSMGIFPNARKVGTLETHSLEVFFGPHALKYRRPKPKLLPEIIDFYKIICEQLEIDEEEGVVYDKLEPTDPKKRGNKIDFDLNENTKEIFEKFNYYQDKDAMYRIYFPFGEPNMLFTAKDGTADVFVNFNRLDGNAVIIGFRFTGKNLQNTLMWFCETAKQYGMRYIELLVNAHIPQMQRIALDIKFLPCAYFPSMQMNHDGEREDFLIFSRSFENLDFTNMHLVETNQKFLDAFMKCWYEMLIRCQPDFDEEWRIA